MLGTLDYILKLRVLHQYRGIIAPIAEGHALLKYYATMPLSFWVTLLVNQPSLIWSDGF